MSEEANENETNQDEIATNEPEAENSKDEAADSGDNTKGQDKESDKSDPRKPDWMSDAIWKDNFAKVEGDLDMEKVAKWYSESYSNATKALHTRKDVIRDEVKKEVEQERFKHRPAEAKDYEISSPEVLKEVGLDVEIDNDDPILIQFKNWAYEQGLSQEQFKDIINMHFAGVTKFFPDWEEEREKLGDNADARVAHLNSWLSKVLSPEAYKAAESLAMDAGKVLLLEELSQLSGNVAFSNEGNVPANTAMNREQIMELMKSEKYLAGDLKTVKTVQAAWARLTNNQ